MQKEIRINKKHKLKQIKSDNPITNNIYYDSQNEYIIKTNGFILAKIKVESNIDKDMIVLQDDFNKAKQIDSGTKKITVNENNFNIEHYPNYKKAFPKDETRLYFKINAKQLYNLAQALGNDNVFIEIPKSAINKNTVEGIIKIKVFGYPENTGLIKVAYYYHFIALM